jgi:hypothetical protein
VRQTSEGGEKERGNVRRGAAKQSKHAAHHSGWSTTTYRQAEWSRISYLEQRLEIER